MTTPVRRALPCAALAAAALALLPAAGADAASRSCPSRAGTIAKAPLGRVWHKGHSLYACTVVYGARARTVRLGPWSPVSRVAWDGVQAAWTVPLTRGGVRSDRAWAASAENGRRWLTGTRLVPRTATADAREARIQRILVRDESAAWVTRTGEVVLAVRSPQTDPEAVGALGASPVADHLLTLAGTFAQLPATQLAATASLVEGDGEGDECGGSNPYTLTVTADPATGPVGVTRWGAWERVDDCG